MFAKKIFADLRFLDQFSDVLSLNTSKIIIGEKEYFQTNVYQSSEIYLKKDSALYENCLSSGTDFYKNISIHKALNEAIERLAYFEILKSEDLKNKYAFDKDPSTSGMAAHKSLKLAKQNARLEAFERYALQAFNEGLINVQPETINGQEGLILSTDSRSERCLIIWKNIDGFYAYGFSGYDKGSLSSGFHRAQIELDRNIRVLQEYYQNPKPIHLTLDQRLVFFSTNQGFQKFRSLVTKEKKIHDPRLILNSKIEGWWTEYSCVWRCVLQPISKDFYSKKIDYFLF